MILPTAVAPIGAWGQCGGFGWADTVASTCVAGTTCTEVNSVFAHCRPVSASSISAPVGKNGPTKTVGKLPALGWNSWNAYRGDITETKIVAAANEMVSLGLKDAGYNYINIDDCWSDVTGRNKTDHRLIVDFKKFPNGIKAVSDAVHDLGLKIGIYSDSGTLTCGGYPGSLGYEKLDVELWASWDIDYLKYDNCNVPKGWDDPVNPSKGYDWYDSPSAVRYRRMTDALNSVSRPIEFGLCNWGQAHVWTWGARVGHSWRIELDSYPRWEYIRFTIALSADLVEYTDFWAHNDMDMMEIGNGNMTLAEERSHFASWVFFKSPILLGTDMSKLSKKQLDIIKNPELLAFHQDNTVGAPAKPYKSDGTNPPEYYSGQSKAGTHVFVVNFSDAPSTKTIKFHEVKELGGESSFKKSYEVHDMWTGEDVGILTGSYSFILEPHDTAAYLIVESDDIREQTPGGQWHLADGSH